jgi:anaerobic selenocysteine-containing dehydrogenase
MTDKITRRGFLKLGAATASSLALSTALLEATANAGMETASAGSLSRTTGRYRRSIPSTCQLCPAHCGLHVFVDEGHIIKIEGNPHHPNNQGRICASGQAGINLAHDPDRLLYPLKRVGARGERKWKRISWEEAYEEVASRLRAIRERGHPEEFIFQSGIFASQRLISRFLDAFGTPNAIIQTPAGGFNKTVAHQLTWGVPELISDAAHSHFILNFGSNPYEAHIYHVPLVRRIIEGRVNNGARMVTFDVRLSNTAGRSDEWFPIKPGTDGLVALAMANVIMQEGLHHQQFVDNWINYPADKLARYLAPYTPEMAERVSGVRASDIRRIAIEFATQSPATIITGAGLSMHLNGTQNERCAALLSAITGNIDVRGGNCFPRTYDLIEPEPAPEPPARKSRLTQDGALPFTPHVDIHSVMPLIQEGRQRIGLYMTYMHNPLYSNPSTILSAEVLKDEKLVPYYVAVDIYLSEAAQLADLVLPDTTYLERWDLVSGPGLDMVPYVALQQPVVSPPGEAVPFQDVLFELARRLGGDMERFFSFSSIPDYLEAVASQIPGLAEAGGLDYLKENGVWFDPESKPRYKLYERDAFPTPSGMAEVYSEAMAAEGFLPLPAYEPIDGHDSAESEGLILTTFKPPTLSPANGNSKWLLEIAHYNPMWINPRTARKLGIKNWGLARLQSEQGSIEVRVRYSHGIHPQVVAISGGLGHRALGRVARGEKFKSSDPDTELIWWSKEGNGFSPNSLIPVKPAAIGGGQAWHDTLIRLAPIQGEKESHEKESHI